MKKLSDEMLKHTINILACFSFVLLKGFERFGLKHSILPTTIFVRNEPKTCFSSLSIFHTCCNNKVILILVIAYFIEYIFISLYN